jgi:hypothetical protein
MKTKSIALVLIIAITPLAWAEPSSLIVSNNIDRVAREIQTAIPQVSFDGLFEARREKNGWSYIFWNNQGKIWVEKVYIRLTHLDMYETRIQVDAYREESGMFYNKRKPKPELVQKTCEWLKRLKVESEPCDTPNHRTPSAPVVGGR